MDTLGFGCILPTAGRIGDFHPLERMPTGHTKNLPRPRRRAARGDMTLYTSRLLHDVLLHHALSDHRIRDLLKARDICAHDIVAFLAVTFRGVVDVVVNVHHDLLQLCIHFLKRPA